jgi:hypothetical protein
MTVVGSRYGRNQRHDAWKSACCHARDRIAACQAAGLGLRTIQRLLTLVVFAHVEGPYKSRDSANPVEREERPGE